jgi:hypothetical protein
MGMFDEIIIPRSYLKGILNRECESLFDTNHKFQTKDFEKLSGGSLDIYKLYRNQLSQRIGKNSWKKVNLTQEVNFYTSFTSKSGDDCWFEFKFKFINGKVDSKELIDKIITNKESKEEIDRMWDIEQDVFEEYRQKWSYKFWTRVERLCQKLSVLARKRHSIPYSLRQTAYKTSGRLEKDPDCLKIYLDN